MHTHSLKSSSVKTALRSSAECATAQPAAATGLISELTYSEADAPTKVEPQLAEAIRVAAG